MKSFLPFLVLLLSVALNAAPVYQEKTVTDGGTIRGKVLWKSAPPATESIPVAESYQSVCGKSKAIPGGIGKNGEAPNAVVFIEEILSGKKQLAPGRVQLDQRNCEYVPHVLIVPQNTEVEILNSDPFLHNVHTYNFNTERPSTIFNLAFPVAGQKVTRKFSDGGKILTLCDAGHPWMSAHIFVTEHPYYAVTDTSGNFSLDQIPPGKYQLRLWHEGTPKLKNNSNTGFLATQPIEQSRDVTVEKKQTVTVDFAL